MYVIRRVGDGKFVAPSGRPSSYVSGLQDARTFRTKEAAERECCNENESVWDVEEVLKRPED